MANRPLPQILGVESCSDHGEVQLPGNPITAVVPPDNIARWQRTHFCGFCYVEEQEPPDIHFEFVGRKIHRASVFIKLYSDHRLGDRAPEGQVFMIRRCDERDFDLIWTIINDGAQAYKGTIPSDRWTEPYMSREKLQYEIEDGVLFWGYEDAGTLLGVMGIQHVQDVTLIRHAYTRTSSQKRGIGGQLLAHLRELTSTPVLIGTWADATWAIHFYERHDFQRVEPQEKDRLLKKYWTIPERQIETSVVLADTSWRRLASQT